MSVHDGRGRGKEKDVLLTWMERGVQGSNELWGCFDRAVVTWSERSIGRAAGIWGSFVHGVWELLRI